MGRVAARRAAGWGERSIHGERERTRLRKSLTPQEVKLWVRLRSLRGKGFHIRRQAPIGQYIVDFVCFNRKIIIEADSGQHGLPGHSEQDRIRNAFLRSQGYRIMRFWNSDIDANLDGVMTVSTAALRSPHPDRLTPVDPPHEGEG
jgi:very-short-patch-repair endonuclease